MRDAIDGITLPSPELLEQLGLDALVYTGNARPSQAWVDECRARGIAVTFIQETYSTRSTEGYAVGAADCRYAESRAKEYGHVGAIAVVVSDGNYADRWNASDYGRGWSDAATLPFFPYGAHGVIDGFHAGAQAGAGAHLLVLGDDNLPGMWVPETWGPTNLIGQVVGASPVPDSDLNHVHADYTGAAPAPTPPPVVLPQESDTMLYHLPFSSLLGDRRAILFGPDGKMLDDWFGKSELGKVVAASNEAPVGVPEYVVRSDDPNDPIALKLVALADNPAAPTEVAVKLTDAQLAKIAAGVTVDPAVIATAVNDDAAARLAKV